MADIDQIIAGGAGASSRADFSQFGDPVKAFFDASKSKSDFDLRRAFKDGVPTTPDGQPDFGAMAKTLFQKGGLDQGVAASNLALQQSKLKYGQETDASINPPPNGGAPQQPVVGPSTSRNSVSIDPSKRADITTPQPQQPTRHSGDQAGSIVGVVSAAGIPDELAGPVIAQVSALTKTDPNASLDPQLSLRVQQVVQAAAQRIKGGQPQQPTGLQPQQPQAAPQQQPQAVPQPPTQLAQAQPQAPQVQLQPGPQAIPPQSGATDPRFVGLVPAGRSPDQQVHLLQRAIDSGILPPEQTKSYQNAIDAIRKAAEPTAEEKTFAASRRNPALDDYVAQNEATKAAATEDAKAYVAKYNNIDEAGTKAIQEIPKLQTALKLMDSPDFYSGIGNNYNLALKRVAVALGGDTDKAAPQEIVGKVIADSVLNGLGSLKGLGPIRVAEMNLARTAAMSPDNTPQTNRFLANVAIRIQQRAVQISDLAQKYKDDNGKLDVGFDRQVRAIDKQAPLISPDEVHRFQSIIDGKEKQPQRTAAAVPPVPGAKQAPDGNFYVPDSSRPGKYLKVVQ